MKTFVLQIRAFEPRAFWQDKIQDAVNSARTVKTDFDFALNNDVDEWEFGFGSIRFTGTDSELNTLIKAIHANERSLKLIGVIDTSETIAEIRLHSWGYSIRENYYSPGEKTCPIDQEQVDHFLDFEKKKELKRSNRVLFWIGKDKLEKLLSL